MNYYPHHIGDFNNATRHLTRIERSIYRDMLELYYDTEQPLTTDVKALCRKLIARTDEEVTAVQQLLNEFFTETEHGWTNDRCDMEICRYHEHISNKSSAGKASAEARAAAKAAALASRAGEDSTGVEQVLYSRSTNQEPGTSNQEPHKTKAETQRASRLPADWTPSDEDMAFCQTERPDLTVASTASRFRDYWIAQPGAKGKKTDWPATWRNWVRNERQQQARASPAGYQTPNDKAKSFADRLTGRAKNEQRHEIIDIN